MTRLALCLLLLATGAGAEELIDSSVRVVHDDMRGVTCYLYKVYQGASIFCIPDSQLSADTRRQLSPHEQEDGPTPAAGAPAWNDERYSM
ncbi:hypothetical protein [Pseudomonas sp. MRSN 12121]|uniref:hypothetical protein n=1 Tax=Pseudomonas sp. MRSN 12121 TaxID=1611770 RepID=UPI0005BEBC7C|nr:hypothetical protein [Pseudomonas sp. MRSN 12121]AJO77762.1 hypothetical protein TO66_10810 [Pseudomonas sp. MRSN 12121]